MIKNATIQDLDILNIINKEVQDMHHSFSPKRFKAHSDADMKKLFTYFLDNENACILLKYYNNKAIGYLIYEIRKTKETGFTYSYNFIYVHHISIDKKYKRKGFAKELFNEVLIKAKELDIDTIELDVYSKNFDSKSAFKKFGFKNYMEKMELKL